MFRVNFQILHKSSRKGLKAKKIGAFGITLPSRSKGFFDRREHSS
ncbi:hypothetical protein C943_03427 [Mariniradius saccharolyticus AK6]|uniref:Uncharacterized protein n=1 Tax=Mariniradius saccharolyticus AK6 TaxID=1239962 RepID=M7XBD3_9BACT|nr:hypothetical protein C943_03427 [Mariniradius saccharolyticus AK6]